MHIVKVSRACANVKFTQEIRKGLQKAHTGGDVDGLAGILSEDDSMDSRVI